MGLTIQFSSSGWLNQVAFPALRKFFEMKADLKIGEGLAYIAAPILGGGIVLALIYKYAIPCIKEKYEEHMYNVTVQEQKAALEAQEDREIAEIEKKHEHELVIDPDNLFQSDEDSE